MKFTPPFIRASKSFKSNLLIEVQFIIYCSRYLTTPISLQQPIPRCCLKDGGFKHICTHSLTKAASNDQLDHFTVNQRCVLLD